MSSRYCAFVYACITSHSSIVSVETLLAVSVFDSSQNFCLWSYFYCCEITPNVIFVIPKSQVQTGVSSMSVSVCVCVCVSECSSVCACVCVCVCVAVSHH